MTKKVFLILVLFIALALRFWGIWDLDILGDEAANAFRAVGYLDYLGTSFQTQPIEWYKNAPLPFWTKLSFHDFPPLAILIQHIFFRFFGDSLSVARLPAVLFGVGAVLLAYLLILHFIKNHFLALLAASLFAINGAMVWIFRTSLLEPTLLFFILLSIYTFLKFLENQRYWWLFGATLGLVALTKYTGFFIIPVYLFYLILKRRSVFKDRRLYGALSIVLALFTPVIVYNIYLFNATGHFDLQFSYLLGQSTPEWTGLLGKIQSPFSDYWKNLINLYGLPFLIIVLIGILYSIFVFLKRQDLRGQILFLWLYFISATLLFIKIGVADRFLTLYGPAFIVFAALAILFIWNAGGKSPWLYFFRSLIILFLIFEAAFMLQKNFLAAPDYGIAKLDHYLERELGDRESAVVPETDNPHLNNVIRAFAREKSTGQPDFFAIIYNDNVAISTLEWIFYRRFFYHSTPTFFIENFASVLQREGSSYFQGFDLYFIQSTEYTLLNPFKKDKTVGLEFEQWLQNQGLEPSAVIRNYNNVAMFRVYKFSL